MNKHKCIKCKTDYESLDEDAYLCDSCNEERLAMAREIDAKVGSTVGQQPNGMATRYEAMRRSGQLKVINGIPMINAKDLI